MPYFFFLKAYFTIACRKGLLAVNSHRFSMSQKVFITLTLNNNFTLYRILDQWSFTLFSPCLPNTLWKFCYNAYPCISINKPAHLLLSKISFFFVIGLLELAYDMPNFIYWHLFYLVMFSETHAPGIWFRVCN